MSFVLMEESSSAFLTFVVIIVVYILVIHRSGLPKGPRGFPLVGNALQLGRNEHEKLSEWATKYGSYYSLNLFGKSALVVNDLATIKQVFGSIESTGKIKHDWLGILLNNSYGISHTEGAEAAEQKKFFVQALVETGAIGGTAYEENVLKSAEQLCTEIEHILKSDSQSVFHLSETFHNAAFNAIWNTTCGQNLTKEKKDFFAAFCKLFKYISVTGSYGLATVPLLWLIGYIHPSFRKLKYYSKDLRSTVKYILQSETSSLISKDPNIFSLYAEKINKCTDTGSTFYGELGNINSYSSIMALFVGGSEPTAGMMNWLIFYMASTPSAQEKLQDEIDTVIGLETPGFHHKSRMIYLQAVILETLRMSSVIPIGALHTTINDMQIDGYLIRKGTILIANIYHVHYDSGIWGDSKTFRPERFITSSNQLNTDLKENVIPFQVGRRACPGEPVARDFIFLMSAKLFGKFSVKMESGRSSKEYLEPTEGIIRRTKNLRVLFQHRRMLE